MSQSGCYLYRQGGRIVAREPWRVETDRDGTKRITSYRDATDFGVWLEVNARVNRDGTCDYDFCLKATQTGPDLKSARYAVKDGSLFWAVPPTKNLLPVVPPTAHFFPLMRYFTGDMVRAIAQEGGTKTVIVPDIRNFADLSNIFAPLASVRSLVDVHGDAKTFDLSGGAYEAPARLYLNEAGVLSHYAFTDPTGDEWTCDLEMG
jgi:hypothetical protein